MYYFFKSRLKFKGKANAHDPDPRGEVATFLPKL